MKQGLKLGQILGLTIVLPSAFILLVILAKSSITAQNSHLANAISIDFLVVLPLVYLALIRKSKIPKTTAIPLMILGLVAASYSLPSHQLDLVNSFKTWVLPLIEVSLLGFVLFKIRQAKKSYSEDQNASTDFLDRFKSALNGVLPSALIPAFSTEIAVFYYAFIKWKKSSTDQSISYHQKSGSQALLIAFLLIIFLETFALHFLLALWSNLSAWILTALSLYTALQVFAWVKSLSLRPIEVQKNRVLLRYGIMSELYFDKDLIKAIRIDKKPVPADPLTKSLSPLGPLESHNIVIEFKEVQNLVGLYGFKKEVQVLKLHVDAPEVFVDSINK